MIAMLKKHATGKRGINTTERMHHADTTISNVIQEVIDTIMTAHSCIFP